MNEITNKVDLFKNLNVNSLLSTETNFSIFTSDILSFTKTVDRPNEYYVEGDEIIFTINLKNNGNKKLTNFILKDELEPCVKPFNDSYKVTTTIGEIKSYTNPITIEKITLDPNQQATITITGLVSYM